MGPAESPSAIAFKKRPLRAVPLTALSRKAFLLQWVPPTLLSRCWAAPPAAMALKKGAVPLTA